MKYGLSASALASWISDCATLRQHIFDSHPSSLPGRSILHPDTLEVYGFKTEKPNRVIPQDVIKFVQDVQDAVYALPQATATSYKSDASSPYRSIKFRGFVVWHFRHVSPRFPNPLPQFTSAKAAGMDNTVWDYIFDTYNRTAERPTHPLVSINVAKTRSRDALPSDVFTEQHPNKRVRLQGTSPADATLTEDFSAVSFRRRSHGRRRSP